MKKILFPGLLTLTFLTQVKAQIVGPEAYIPGYYVNIGVAGAGGFEGADTLSYPASGTVSGLHPRSNTNYLGFVANPQLDGWANFNGDFFTPGTPENGWGIELESSIGSTTGIKASNNRASPYEIIGSVTNWQFLNGCYVVDWDGNYVGGGFNVHVGVRYRLKQDDLYYTTEVKIINNGASMIPELYYYRNVDPDNNVVLSGSYTTTNSVVSQPSGVCGKALVSATQTSPGPSYMGFAAIGPDYRVCHGGFSNRDGSDLWNLVGFDGTVGTQTSADEAISLSYKQDSLMPGDTANIRFVVILDAAQAENAISSLFYFDYAGGLGAPKPLCSNSTDSAFTCPGKSVHIQLQGQNLADFSWTWSPSDSLDTTTGTTVNASPTSTTTYTVTGTPVGGCFTVPIIEEIVVAIDNNTSIDFDISTVQPICANNNGSLEVTSVTGGIGPVTIQWTGGPTTNLYDNLFSGIYEVTLTDSFGCYKDSTLYLENVTPMTANITIDSLALCDAPSGQFTVTPVNGTAPFTYDIGTGPGSSPTFSGLAAGSYMVGVLDQNGCLIFEPVTINDTTMIQSSGVTTSENCDALNGTATITVTGSGPSLSYHIGSGPSQSSNVFTGLASGTYNVFVVDNYGCKDTVSITVNDTADLAMSIISHDNDQCSAGIGQIVVQGVNGVPPYSYNIGGTPQASGTFSGLNAGVYTVHVTSGSCDASATFTLTDLPSNVVASIDQVIDENCGANNGQIFASATNGRAPYSYSISGGGTSSTGHFTGLNNITYIVTATDSIGCTDTAMATIGLIPISIDLGPDVTYCNSYTFTPSAVGDYVWTDSLGNLLSTQHNYTVSNNGTYILTVSMPEPGCIDSDTVHVEFIQEPIITPANIFTPNGDGMNDKFKIENQFVSTYHIAIFNRWGQVVFSSNNINDSWDGKFNGNDADSGVYLYVIEYDNPCESPSQQTRHGSIQLVR